jgi:hypothetical protein
VPIGPPTWQCAKIDEMGWGDWCNGPLTGGAEQITCPHRSRRIATAAGRKVGEQEEVLYLSSKKEPQAGYYIIKL